MSATNNAALGSLPAAVIYAILTRCTLSDGAHLAMSCRAARDALAGVNRKRIEELAAAVADYMETPAFAKHRMHLYVHALDLSLQQHTTLLVASGDIPSITFIHGMNNTVPPSVRIEYAYNNDNQKDDFMRRGLKRLLNLTDQHTVESNVLDGGAMLSAQDARAVASEVEPMLRNIRACFGVPPAG